MTFRPRNGEQNFWLEDREKKSILEFHRRNPPGDRFHGKPSKKGTGFQQPTARSSVTIARSKGTASA
jgi:hypothetical protein